MLKLEAVVLAGGFGTRLQSVVQDVPKPMAPVAGKPFLHRLLANLSQQGVQRVVLATGYKHEIIEKYFGYSFMGMEIIQSPETSPLGTGGALRQALNYCQTEECFLLNGDTFFDVKLADLSSHRLAKNADIMLALKPLKNFDRYGCVITDTEGRVLSFAEKKPQVEGLINGGVYLLKHSLFRNGRFPATFSFEADFLEKKLKELRVFATQSEGYFIDIGVPEDYARAQTELADLT